jgi:hypothetical protein
LEEILSGTPEELEVHLQLLERDVAVEESNVRLHCHCLTVDANARVKVERLAEFMRSVISDYAIPRSRLAEARNWDRQHKSSRATMDLYFEARNTFTDLAKTGEGGEMLLYLLAERFLKLPLVLCKMDLKTDKRLHYHGADGVYAGLTDQGILKLFWGESKIYGDATEAVRDCLKSLAPFILEPDEEGATRDRDLVLLGDKADLEDERLTSAFQKYFDRKLSTSNRVRYCGIALVGFDASFYPEEGAAGIAENIAASAKTEMSKWVAAVRKRIKAEKLNSVEIHFLCVPLPSAKGFRSALLTSLGLKNDAHAAE